MNAPWERRGAPRPPRAIEAEMEEAGRTGDMIRLGIARARYKAWLEDQGIHEGLHGTERPDGAVS